MEQESSAERLYAEAPTELRPEECAYYHVMDLPGLGVVGGQWDLRGRVDEYLGHVAVDGKRVLEIGPASGYLTSELERRGASVVAVELGPETPWDVVPQAGLDVDEIARDRLAKLQYLRNGWWMSQQRLGGSARVHYGSAYALPDELGRFDVAVMACVLLHMRDPLQALANAASVTDDTLTIVERRFPELGSEPVARLAPSATNGVWDTWWDFTPEFLVQYVEVLGFGDVAVTHHEQRHLMDEAEDEIMIPLFTIVARR